MIPITEIKQELIAVLKNLYGNQYRYYGMEVKEGYKKPSFFTQLVPVSSVTETARTKDRVFLFAITYFQKEINETDAMNKVSEIENAYGTKVKISSERYANVTEFDFEYVGADLDILQITFTVSFKDTVEETKKTQKTVKNAVLAVEMEG